MTGYAIHHLRGEELWLLPEKAIYWPRLQILLLSDLHLGKASHFRKNGLYVPSTVLRADLYMLDNLLALYPVKRMIFLGDLFHSVENSEWEFFGHWLLLHPVLKVDLVKGNHDVLKDDLYARYNIVIHSMQLCIGPLLLQHHSVEEADHCDGYVLCGHLHPSYLLRGKGKQYLKLPCFYFNERQGIMPAFGSFTGTMLVEPDKKSDLFVVAGAEVLKIEYR